VTTLLRRTLALTLLALTASTARADLPTVTEVTEKGRDAALRLEWGVTRVQLRGGDAAATYRINFTLRAEVRRQLSAMRRDLRDWEEPEGFDASSLELGMSVGRLDARLLSVNISTFTYYAGAAHPNNSTVVLTFDVRTGRRISTRSLFAPGAGVMARVARLVDAKLRAEHDPADGEYYLSTVEPSHLRSVLATPEGYCFIFGNQELGPHAAGVPSVTLTYAELAGLADARRLPVDGLTARLPGR
jgi:hypothetical protein